MSPEFAIFQIIGIPLHILLKNLPKLEKVFSSVKGYKNEATVSLLLLICFLISFSLAVLKYSRHYRWGIWQSFYIIHCIKYATIQVFSCHQGRLIAFSLIQFFPNLRMEFLLNLRDVVMITFHIIYWSLIEV